MSGRPLSLKLQLLLWLLAPLLVINILAAADTWRSARSNADEILDRVLAGSVLAISERVVISETGEMEVDIPYVALEMLTSSSQDRIFYRVDRSDGLFVTGYKALEVESDPAMRPGSMRFGDGDYQGAAIRYAHYQGSVSTGSAPVEYRVIIAETTSARQKLANTLLTGSLLRQALFFIAAPALVWFGVTRALAPLYALRDAIGRRSPGDLRQISHDVPLEMQGILDATNGFLNRLRGALEAMRHFAGNASHQLRTPLAIVRTNLALAQRAGNLEDVRKLVNEADREIANAERTLAQLLVLARVDESATHALESTLTDIAALSREVSAEAAPGAGRRGVDLGYEGTQSLLAPADPVLLREAIRNLVDNSLRYAKSVVTVSASEKGDSCTIEVADDGPGMPAAARARAGQRFFRSDEKPASGATVAHGNGAGLGLAIVREIAVLHGGRLDLEQAQEGGLLARIQLPANKAEIIPRD